MTTDNKTNEVKKKTTINIPKPKFPQPKTPKFNLNNGAAKVIRKAAARGR